MRYVRLGLQHQELQNSSMNQLHDEAESYFVNRGPSITTKNEYSTNTSNCEQKHDGNVKPLRSKWSLKRYNNGKKWDSWLIRV